MKKFETITKTKALETLKAVLMSKFYPFVTAAVMLLCYYLGWDLVAMYYLSITGILMLFLLDDISPIISVLLFACVIVSLQNTPSPKMGNSDSALGNSDYYLRTENLVQICIILALSISAFIYKIIRTIISKKFTITPVFWGLAAFAVILLMSGFFSENYSPKNLLFGLITAACFLLFYCALKDNLKLDSAGFERIAFGFLAFSVLLLIELIVAYFTTEGLFYDDGDINRSKLVFGWGVYNTLGVYMVMCIPAVIYLAWKYKYGFVLTLYSVLLFVGIILSCSRQAMVGAVIIYPVCIILLLIKCKNRIPNICVMVAAIIAGIILLILYREKVLGFFSKIFDNLIVDNELNGSGRAGIWREAINNYRNAPLLGMGFYVTFSGYTIKSGLSFFPFLCHGTVFQLLSSCGTIGIIAYAYHRLQTIKSYCKNITMERTFIALIIVGLLIVSLVDNHLFNVFPAIIYSCLLAVLTSSEVKE